MNIFFKKKLIFLKVLNLHINIYLLHKLIYNQSLEFAVGTDLEIDVIICWEAQTPV